MGQNKLGSGESSVDLSFRKFAGIRRKELRPQRQREWDGLELLKWPCKGPLGRKK